VCVHCHSGAGAPQGLQLDAAHSYALLVGVPSNEEPGLLRVQPGVPGSSYIALKLEGSSAIVGAQMPFGGPAVAAVHDRRHSSMDQRRRRQRPRGPRRRGAASQSWRASPRIRRWSCPRWRASWWPSAMSWMPR